MQRSTNEGVKEIDLEVSIPFEREGVCKAIVTFQNDEQILKLVSIPFEREGVCKVTSGRRTTERVKKFQFPSSGKVYAKSIKIEGGIDASDKFQFPSSGKVYAKTRWRLMTSTTMVCFNSLRAGRCMQSREIWG